MQTGPEFLVTFLYYFVCTALIVLLVVSQGMGISLESRFPYFIGMLAGLVAGAIGAYFNRSVTFSLPLAKNKKTLSKSFIKTLGEMGFNENGQIGDFTIYSKSPLRTLFAGRILLKTETNALTIISRANTVKLLREKLDG